MKIQSILLAGLLATLGACTDLSETLYDKIDANEYGQTDAQIASIVGRAYASLRGGSFDGANGYAFSEYVYFISAISSDEAVLPARNGGADWYDGGRYVQLNVMSGTTRTWRLPARGGIVTMAYQPSILLLNR